MYQQTYCHTLSKPFFKIFLFRIYVPTIQTYPHHIDSIFAETSVPVSTHSAPIQPPQTNPPTTQPHTLHNHTHHRYRAHTAPQIHTPTRRSPGPADADVDAVDVDAQPASSGLTVRPLGRTRSRSPDALAATHRSAIGQARHRIRPHKNRQYQSTPAIGQARYRIRLDRPDRIRPKPDQAGLDKVRPGIRQAGYSTKIRPYQTSRNQAGRVHNRIRP